MDGYNYIGKLNGLISNRKKSSLTGSTKVQITKSDINNTLQRYKTSEPFIYKPLQRVGQYSSGHFYGLTKNPKNESNPPLRPIISVPSTVSHELVKYFKTLIQPYFLLQVEILKLS